MQSAVLARSSGLRGLSSNAKPIAGVWLVLEGCTLVADGAPPHYR